MIQNKTLAKIVRLRNEKGLSQENMADALNVKQSTYCNWEKGKPPLTLAKIDQIAQILGVNPLDLITDESVIIINNDQARENQQVNRVNQGYINNQDSAKDMLIESYQSQIELLREKILRLEAENERLKNRITTS